MTNFRCLMGLASQAGSTVQVACSDHHKQQHVWLTPVCLQGRRSCCPCIRGREILSCNCNFSLADNGTESCWFPCDIPTVPSSSSQNRNSWLVLCCSAASSKGLFCISYCHHLSGDSPSSSKARLNWSTVLFCSPACITLGWQTKLSQN